MNTKAILVIVGVLSIAINAYAFFNTQDLGGGGGGENGQ